jgi:hypothetical protein
VSSELEFGVVLDELGGDTAGCAVGKTGCAVGEAGCVAGEAGCLAGEVLIFLQHTIVLIIPPPNL